MNTDFSRNVSVSPADFTNRVKGLFEKESITLMNITLIFTYNLRNSYDFFIFFTIFKI